MEATRLIMSASKWLPVYAAIMILTVPLRVLFALLFSVLLHELCHLIALRYYGLQIYSIYFSPSGARIHTQPMTDKQQLICALAGPIGGLLPLFFIKSFPVFCFCSLAHSIFNLLPAYPMDGGRALYAILSMLTNTKNAARLCDRIGYSAMVGIIFLLFNLSVIYRSYIFAVVALLIFFTRKIPCKQSLKGVQ